MNKERKLIIAGNWKMNKTVAESLALVGNLKLALAHVREVDIVVCPPLRHWNRYPRPSWIRISGLARKI